MKLLTPHQRIIIDEFVSSKYLKSTFYFTGGTALAAVYLQHRESEDLDFFSEARFEASDVFNLITTWSKKHQFEIDSRIEENVNIYTLSFADGIKLKIDFNHYPYKRIATGPVVESIQIDSLIDIAVNKLLTINQRAEVKDFVDLYFLLEDFSLWDLINGVKEKFRVELEISNLAADFFKVEEFDYLPKMHIPLKLDDLKKKYKELSKKLAKNFVDYS